MPTVLFMDLSQTMEPMNQLAPLTAQYVTRVQSIRLSTHAAICACAMIVRWSIGVVGSTAEPVLCVVRPFAMSFVSTNLKQSKMQQAGDAEQTIDL